jgi:hypothetical protein
MSLKAFHILFVAASIVLSFGFAAWALAQYSNSRDGLMLVFGLGSGAAGVGLVFYGRYVLKKLKKISYL